MSVVKQSAIWTCDSCGDQERTPSECYPGNFNRLSLDTETIYPHRMDHKVSFDICDRCYPNAGGDISNPSVRTKVAKFFLKVLKRGVGKP